MLVQSFISVLESAAANHQWRNASGYVADVDTLFTDETMRALDDAHPGCFAFLAFDGKADPLVAEYISGGSLAMDSGSDVMVLFTTQGAVPTPRRISHELLPGIAVVDTGKHPAYDVIRKLVPEVSHPPLPCAVVFDRFVSGAEPVIVALGDAASAADVRSRLQQVFGLASAARRTEAEGDFTLRLSASLAGKGIPYVRGGQNSMREWIAFVLRWAKQNASTIVSVLKLFG